MRLLALIPCCLALASCATQPSPSPSAGPQGAAIAVSPECLAAKLRPADPMPVSMVPEDVLRKAQSGWVAVRYDVVKGKATNAVVVSSEPPGLYDTYVLRHASAYTEPTGATVRGCIMTTNIKF
jgi:hypothetical protein